VRPLILLLASVLYLFGQSLNGTGPAMLLGTVATPVDSPGAGTYASTQSVTLSATHSSSILYTVDGGTPARPSSGTAYSGAFDISVTTTLKVVGCNSPLWKPSAVDTAVYTITP